MCRDVLARECSREMASLDNEKRPTFARDKNQIELHDWLVLARKSVREFLPSDSTFITSDDNRVGKDILGAETGTSVELKSPDGKTDGNVGLSSIEWTLDDTVGELSGLMRDSMANRRQIYFDTGISERMRSAGIDKSKAELTSALRDYFSSRLTIGHSVPIRLSHFAYCVSVGVTKLPEIRDSFDSGRINLPVLLVADWHLGFRQYEQAFKPSEKIVTSQITEDGATKRLTVTLEGEESGRKCRLYPHFKNSYSQGDRKIPANCWVKTPCFHIWIDA